MQAFGAMGLSRCTSGPTPCIWPMARAEVHRNAIAKHELAGYRWAPRSSLPAGYVRRQLHDWRALLVLYGAHVACSRHNTASRLSASDTSSARCSARSAAGAGPRIGRPPAPSPGPAGVAPVGVCRALSSHSCAGPARHAPASSRHQRHTFWGWAGRASGPAGAPRPGAAGVPRHAA